ncbi:hypothetical protein KJ605_00565 [Patescibacteria group bacterium]|nr:hypothetical protein [Patescibacteria group bacterium]MBU1970261.1 hypothetical protein [Patescibacteria group bacterium]
MIYQNSAQLLRKLFKHRLNILLSKIIISALLIIGGFLVVSRKEPTTPALPVQEDITVQQSNNMPDDTQIENQFLPDLLATPPRELFIEYKGEIKTIRFSTTFVNIGRAALELRAVHDNESETTRVRQVFAGQEAGGPDRLVGDFVFHPTHGHWHIADYVRFELWSLNAAGEKDELLASTGKMSFCIWDEDSYDLTLENASQSPQYVGCNNETQGISVGWSDTYDARTDGQFLDINAVPDGVYLISTLINPEKRIQERNYTNNEATMLVSIEGTSITPVTD